MQTEVIEVSKLKLDPNNARKHDKKNLAVIKNSLKEFGQRRNVVIDSENVVIAGNGLVTVARELGYKTLTINRFEGTVEQARAYALVDNRSGELSEWDDDILRDTLEGLRGSFELLALGFDESFFNKFADIQGAKELGEDEFSEFEHACPKCGFEFDGKK